MAVTNISATITGAIDNVPLRSPIHGRSERLARDKVDGGTQLDVAANIAESRPWAAWFASIEGLGNQIVVSATIDFGAVGANGFASQIVNFTLPSDKVIYNGFVLTRYVTGAGPLVLAQLITGNRLLVVAFNVTGAPVPTGPLDFEFLIISELQSPST